VDAPTNWPKSITPIRCDLRMSVTRAEATLASAKQDAAATIALRDRHTSLIEDAYKTGALLDSERAKILDRYKTAYATPNVEDAQRTFDATWDAFWNALKRAERQALQGQPTTK
jgi:hypothetical protein